MSISNLYFRGGVWLKALLALIVLWLASPAGFAQNELTIRLSLSHDRIVAGQPLFLHYLIEGIPSNASVWFKQPEQRWISAVLLDADGKEVGTFDGDNKADKQGLSKDGLSKDPAAQDAVAQDDDGVHYVIPKVKNVYDIVVPQTGAVTKPGVYKLVVRVRALVGARPNGPAPQSFFDPKELEPKKYQTVKANKVFRVVVTAADPAALKQKAAELRETFLTGSGAEAVQASHDLINWPSATAAQEWRALVQDPRTEPIDLNTLVMGLYEQASPEAIAFLGELTWKLEKYNARGALGQMYALGDAATKKQISALYLSHGEEVPLHQPLMLN